MAKLLRPQVPREVQETLAYESAVLWIGYVTLTDVR